MAESLSTGLVSATFFMAGGVAALDGDVAGPTMACGSGVAGGDELEVAGSGVRGVAVRGVLLRDVLVRGVIAGDVDSPAMACCSEVAGAAELEIAGSGARWELAGDVDGDQYISASRPSRSMCK